MVVCDFDIEGLTLLPLEADTILLVNADGVLTTSVPAQSLEPISRGYREVVRVVNVIDLIQFAPGNRPQGYRTGRTRDAGIPTDIFRGLVMKGVYHVPYYTG